MICTNTCIWKTTSCFPKSERLSNKFKNLPPIRITLQVEGKTLSAFLLPIDLWIRDHGSRIFYLHLLLLGLLSLTLFQWLIRQFLLDFKNEKLIQGSIIMVLISLMGLTRFWPVSWQVKSLIYIVTLVAALPPVASLYLGLKIYLKQWKTC